MQADGKKRIAVTVMRTQVPAIRSCLASLNHHDFAVRPVISGWSTGGGFWSSERSFKHVGERVEVSFTADAVQIAPIVAAGFGIISGEIIPVRVIDVASST